MFSHEHKLTADIPPIALVTHTSKQQSSQGGKGGGKVVTLPYSNCHLPTSIVWPLEDGHEPWFPSLASQTSDSLTCQSVLLSSSCLAVQPVPGRSMGSPVLPPYLSG